MGREQWVLTPAYLRKDRPAWLVVLVHGFRGRGEDILWLRRAFRDFEDCLFVAPSFPEGFQLLEAASDRQLMELFGDLRRRYQLRDRLFVCGFSAGAQFSHRFAMGHPELVIGCAAHAGGTWGPVIAAGARGVPMFLSCGLDDIARSSPGQSKSRIQSAHAYFGQVVEKRMWVKARLFARLGHETSSAVEAGIAECFQLATRGLYPENAADLRRRIQTIRADFDVGGHREAEAAIAALRPHTFPPPVRKSAPRSTMAGELRQIRRVAHVSEGLGGASANGHEYWVDDRSENGAGWVTNPHSQRAREFRLREFLAWIRASLQRRGSR